MPIRPRDLQAEVYCKGPTELVASKQASTKEPGLALFLSFNNPRVVIPDTGARKVPSTGGPPIVVGALVLLRATLIVERGVLRR
jgi:hypothetical protein